jgi:hypothetical protein
MNWKPMLDDHNFQEGKSAKQRQNSDSSLADHSFYKQH